MKRKKRYLIIVLTVFYISRLVFYPMDSLADSRYVTTDLYGNWQKDDKGWWFKRNYGLPYPASLWGEQGDNWYYFDENGYMATGWLCYYGSWYYLTTETGKNEGAMVTGWHYDEEFKSWYYFSTLGVMVTGWHKIGANWYYFYPESKGNHGKMAVSCYVDGSYIDQTGKMNEN